MTPSESPEFLSSRSRIRRWRAASGVFHLLSVAGFCLALLWAAPRLGAEDSVRIGEEMKERLEARQLLLEALDKLARYERYYFEVHGRYTRDLNRLALPVHFASGRREQLLRSYELSVMEAQPNRFTLLATSLDGSDRVTIDENHRLHANFVLPPPARAYLVEEADRLMRLRAVGVPAMEGLYGRYWRVRESEVPGEWVAEGLRGPVAGERRVSQPERGLASIFASVSQQVKQRMGGGKLPSEAQLMSASAAAPSAGTSAKELSAQDVSEWLEAARLAQHVYRRERGAYARRWEDLDGVSGYGFSERMRAAQNVRVRPIEFAEGSYLLSIEGTAGELLGEQFVLDASGGVKQVRYTETLINQLQQTTNLLNFQINPIVDEAPGRP